jgi:hypothetical protein
MGYKTWKCKTFTEAAFKRQKFIGPFFLLFYTLFREFFLEILHIYIVPVCYIYDENNLPGGGFIFYG